MVVYCTFRFFNDIENLKKNKSYSSIMKDVCDYFKDKSTAELHITKDIIQSSSNIYSLNKFRIINCLSNKGKSSSYRCLCGVFLKEDRVILDTIYPKTGSDSIDNLSKEKYKEIAKNIRDSIGANKIYLIDIENGKFKKI